MKESKANKGDEKVGEEGVASDVKLHLLDEEVEVLSEVEGEDLTVKLLTDEDAYIHEDQSEGVVIYETDLLENVGEYSTPEVGKSFRSNELSEDDLKKRESTPAMEDEWEEGSDHSSHISWIKQLVILGVFIAITTTVWAFVKLSLVDDVSEQRDEEFKNKALVSEKALVDASQDKANIIACVKQYLESTSLEERANICRDPETVLRKMTQHYSNELTFDAYHFEEVLHIINKKTKDMVITMVAANATRSGGEADSGKEVKNLLLVKQDDGSYLVDWETSVTFQPSDWKSFVANKSTEPHVFRAEVRERVLRGPYLYEFSDDAIYQAYRISLRTKPEEFLLGYAKKDSEVDRRLKKQLSKKSRSAKKHEVIAPMIIKVAFPANSQSDQCVEIIEVISDMWFIP